MGANAASHLTKAVMMDDPMPIGLAKAGYDVWLGNSRGNSFSQEHEWLDPASDEEAYWKFSFEEFGTYDLPAMLEMVYEEVGDKKIKYIGTSIGTT